MGTNAEGTEMNTEHTHTHNLSSRLSAMNNLIVYRLQSKLKHARVNGKYEFILECCTAPPNDHECDLYIRCHVNDFAAIKKSFNDKMILIMHIK